MSFEGIGKFQAGRTALVSALAIVLCAACSSGAKVTGGISYQPPFLPLTITVESNGDISLHGDLSVDTPIGTFSLESNISKEAPPVADTTVLIIEHKKGTSLVDSLFRIKSQSVEVSLDGNVQLQITNHRVFVNASRATVQSILVSPSGAALLADTCVVGTWRDRGGHGFGFSLFGHEVPLHSGGGDVDHIFADGFDENTYGADAKPAYGTYKGYRVEAFYGGENIVSYLNATDPHQLRLVENGWRPGSSLSVVYKNHSYKVTFSKGSEGLVRYRCTARTLTWFGKGYRDTETRVSRQP